MKTKKYKRVLTLVLALAMMLSLSMVAFANGSVELYINNEYEDSFTIGNNSTVYDIVFQLSTDVWSAEYDAVQAYSPLYDSNSPLNGLYNHKVCYLSSLNGIGSAPHIPAAGALDENNNYIPTQTADNILREANTLLADYQGLKYWGGNGYGYSADGTHGIYIGWDWVFKVNGSTPGKTISPASPIYDDFFQYTMRESLLANADRIDLNYTYSIFVFSLS